MTPQTTLPATSLWFRVWPWFLVRLYFERAKLIHGDRLPRDGPVLYVALHRNGAVDGWVYRHFIPDAAFLISTQLRRSLLGRLFFAGIEVAREKDAERSADPSGAREALERCLGHLAAGGSLVVMPEGTSTLGPRHLPFKSGAARLLSAALDRGIQVRAVPLGISYEQAWAFRSRVEVWVGRQIDLELGEAAGPGARLLEVKRRVRSALEEVGVNVANEDRQSLVERLACLATLGTDKSYCAALKSFEKDIPAPLLAAWQALDSDIRKQGLLTYQGVPLFPERPFLVEAVSLAALGVVVLGAMLANLPPLLAGWSAGRTFPDGRNVVSLWRILVGAPAFVLWFLLVCAGAGMLGAWPGWGCYVLLTWAGLRLYDRAERLSVAMANGLLHSAFGPRMLAVRSLALESLR